MLPTAQPAVQVLRANPVRPVVPLPTAYEHSSGFRKHRNPQQLSLVFKRAQVQALQRLLLPVRSAKVDKTGGELVLFAEPIEVVDRFGL